jgi:Ca2+-binding EF-hand superfamily protein
MMRILSVVSAFALVLSLTAPATAADPAKKKKKDRGPDTSALFAKLDTNKDQKLSKDEFAAFKGLKEPKKEGKEPKGLSTARDTWFTKLDSNGDGALSPEEFKKIKDVIAANPVAKKKKAK